jgi:hypothetical protein
MPHQCTTCGHVFDDGSKEMLGGCPECGGAKFQFHPKGTEVSDDPPDAAPPDRDGGVAERVGRATTTVRDWVGDDGDPPPDRDPEWDADRDQGRSEAGTDPPSGLDTSDAAASDPGVPADPPTSGTTDPSVSSATPDRSDEDTDVEADIDVEADTTDRPDPAAEGDDIIVADDDPPEERSEASEDRAQATARSEVASPDELPERDDREAPTSEGRVVREPTGDNPDMSELREELNDQFESIKIVEPGQYELNLMELYDRDEYIIALRENGRYVIQMPERWIGSDSDSE